MTTAARDITIEGMRDMRWGFPLFLLVVALLAFGACAPKGAPSDFAQLFAPPYVSDRFIVDLRYATDDNFLHRNVYGRYGINRCWLHPIVAERLMKLAPLLAKERLKLVLWDCYRPVAVQREMWKIVPDPRFVADPAKGSNHNRGMAVDATLADEEGGLLPMPTAFDDFTERAAPAFACPGAERKECENRDLLIRLMREAGLAPLATEWWHFQPEGVDVEKYPVK